MAKCAVCKKPGTNARINSCTRSDCPYKNRPREDEKLSSIPKTAPGKPIEGAVVCDMSDYFGLGKGKK
jgi:hypothetical protein